MQKSVSSTSLYVSSKAIATATSIMADIEDFDTNDHQQQQTGGSISAPVSRQVSSDLNNSTCSGNSQMQATNNSSNCCGTSLKIISDAAKQLMNSNSNSSNSNDTYKKSVAWDENHLQDIEEYSLPNTPIKQQEVDSLQTPINSSDLKSRYKSEPNLNFLHFHKDKSSQSQANEMTPLSKCGKSLTRKLMKGVSMGNLKFPFSTPESTKRLVRTVSSSLKRRLSDETQTCLLNSHSNGTNSNQSTIMAGIVNPLNHNLEDLDDDTFEETADDNLDSSSCSSDAESTYNEVLNDVQSSQDVIDHGSSSTELKDYLPTTSGGVAAAYQQLMLQQSSLYRNLDLITSTPSLLLGRRSMSPITKSTQRMPKAMQVCSVCMHVTNLLIIAECFAINLFNIFLYCVTYESKIFVDRSNFEDSTRYFRNFIICS